MLENSGNYKKDFLSIFQKTYTFYKKSDQFP